ncbi:hypothetical protein T552_01263 [Pneumocystis carinii B80]|uniref:Ran GTPase-activating protein 1 n=1 Tax=Pneumocystis carinii (strain B80) TaxID=1408658 RepID=A0A0W4ZLQ7_PNEC8|nr:hypothetical protein T552_01263 [Pneumocystis carinii B80]KTW29308.1 hypothetical protein T552_01263 [Pneumocystis carinii B80]
MAANNCIFSLSGRGLKLESKEEVLSVIKELISEKNIREIYLNGNTLSVEACQILGEVIRTKKDLEVVDFSDIFTGRSAKEIPFALEYLLSGLSSCEKCSTVYLSDNAFGSTASEPLIAFLSRHRPLKHLYLTNNGLGPSAGACVARALEELAEIQSLDPPVHLETLVCGRNRLENASMKAWSACFRAQNKLTHVKMPQNGIQSQGIRILLETGLTACSLLQTLDLQDNTFTLLGAKTLAKMLPKWPHLIELAVSDCLLSRTGGKLLAQALFDNNFMQLKILRLQYNGIDEEGVKILANAIERTLPSIELLELNGNVFSEEDESVEKIRRIFEKREKGVVDDLDDMEELSEMDSSEELSEPENSDDSSKNFDDIEEKKVEFPIKKETGTNISTLLEETHLV